MTAVTGPLCVFIGYTAMVLLLAWIVRSDRVVQVLRWLIRRPEDRP